MLQPQGNLSDEGGSAAATVVGEDEASVTLRVRVADAQGLRLMKGGEIRLVITLRSTVDKEGGRFGAKVTPWQEVPENAAPVWKAREAAWTLPAHICYEAEFIDSAALSIELMQRGHECPAEKASEPLLAAATPQPGGPAAAWQSLGSRGLGAALQNTALGQRGLTALRAKLASGLEKPPDVVGSLRLPLGTRLVRPADHCEGAQWIQLMDISDGRVKGTLLLELIVVLSLNARPASVVAAAAPAAATPHSAALAESPQPASDVAGRKPHHSPAKADSVDSDSESVSEEPGGQSDTDTDEDSDATPSQASTQPTETAQEGNGISAIGRGGSEPTSPQLPVKLERKEESPSTIKARLAAQSPLDSSRVQSWWLTDTEQPSPSQQFNDAGADQVNIFTINNPTNSSGLARFKHLFTRVSRKRFLRSRRLDEKWRSMRSMLDPATRKQREEVRKWRQWHEVFCTLNDIGNELTAICSLLSQAAVSMRRFGDSHAALQDCVRMAAFMRDAMLYIRSEAEVPRRVEDHLEMLQSCADEYRGMVVQPPVRSPMGEDDAAQLEPWRALEDLQIDLAVILESAVMTAQQALAEYKRLHCRLELLVSEYKPVCRLELESQPVFMPLLVEEGTSQVVAACMPDQAVEWSVDFSSRIGTESKGLEMLVRDLDHRSKQVKSVSASLRNQTLQCMASGKVQNP
mmetsp:Transcript_42188/g.98977  ORF Transcript_42188/g.98977 Transcript_42188/m.98977 type:complete len:690 (-) Transcript_42188:112-2181(-)